mmetsp:Transcript_13820/g.16462  ORF Transcript_13820/g.16462 Transcript_13820/m.16462 type:complete len:276 (+) Transcript_13820:90-917(+)
MSFSNMIAGLSSKETKSQEVEMNPLEDAWSQMTSVASSMATSAKQTTSGFKIPVPQSEEESVSLENAWSKMTKSATAAANSAKKSTVGIAQQAGIKINLEEDKQGDEENLMTGANEAANGLNEELTGLCPALTYKQRIIGAASCIGLGLVLDLFASLAFFMGKAHVTDYAVLYTLGNITAICGSGFIVGPMKQAKVMCKPVRRIACTIYLSTMVATILVAVLYPSIPLIFTLLIIQYCALIWYGASFIPFGRSCIIKSCKVFGKGVQKGVGLDGG